MAVVTETNMFLHQAIHKAGNQEKLGKRLGVSRYTILKWLADVGSMPLRTFIEVSRITGTVAAVKCARKL